MQTVNIGLNNQQRQSVIELLNTTLANQYLLLIKTKKYHWDVVSPQFMTLHELWEQHYHTLTENIDQTAERIRMLGGYPVGTAASFIRYASLREHPGDLPSVTEMVSRLLLDHEFIVRELRDTITQSASIHGDEGTADFLTGLLRQHEEMAWMLRSFMEGESLKSDGTRSQVAAVAN
ncbi:MAG: Dps family protein [Spirulinaceae cyanobacterium]